MTKVTPVMSGVFSGSLTTLGMQVAHAVFGVMGLWRLGIVRIGAGRDAWRRRKRWTFWSSSSVGSTMSIQTVPSGIGSDGSSPLGGATPGGAPCDRE